MTALTPAKPGHDLIPDTLQTRMCRFNNNDVLLTLCIGSPFHSAATLHTLENTKLPSIDVPSRAQAAEVPSVQEAEVADQDDSPVRPLQPYRRPPYRYSDPPWLCLRPREADTLVEVQYVGNKREAEPRRMRLKLVGRIALGSLLAVGSGMAVAADSMGCIAETAYKRGGPSMRGRVWVGGLFGFCVARGSSRRGRRG